LVRRVRVSGAAFLTFPQKTLDEGIADLQRDGLVHAAESWQCATGCREQYFLNSDGKRALSQFLGELETSVSWSRGHNEEKRAEL
jgi:hypothetical protein